MQEKESVMIVPFELKILSVRITVQLHCTSPKRCRKNFENWLTN